jgi:hypothetical protein
MGKISVGAMVLATLFTLAMCKCGWAIEGSPILQQGTIGIGGGPTGEDEPQKAENDLLGSQAYVSHPDKTQEQQAVSTGNAGSPQYPTPTMPTTVQH